ncbi:MAG: hypothetical protein OEV49_15355 [candidate division Zixibacteria bacterium]|nr:hypothetical protein [candidate division Zixibacteria bacterium]MDH3936470.1 hypothetical protein [candidate division Zixibacteria bacterium]MDH4034830.1 hypothetical protein [candidate division Zixibacteria bacterium]
MKDSHYTIVNRALFLIAAAMFVVAMLEWVLRWFGYTLTWLPYGPGRLLELAAMMAVFVIMLLLRQIRDILRSK